MLTLRRGEHNLRVRPGVGAKPLLMDADAGPGSEESAVPCFNSEGYDDCKLRTAWKLAILSWPTAELRGGQAIRRRVPHAVQFEQGAGGRGAGHRREALERDLRQRSPPLCQGQKMSLATVSVARYCISSKPPHR